MKKYLLLIFLPAFAFAQAGLGNFEAVAVSAPVGFLDKILAAISGHAGVATSVGVIVLDVVMRLYPSNNIRSVLSLAGKCAMGVGKIMFVLSDVISKIVPDRPATPELK